LTQLLYLPSLQNCQTLEEFEPIFPNQNNGLAGLDFSTIDDKNKCVWNEESWYNFHYQYFIKNPKERSAIPTLALYSNFTL
jgi:hypothetical protein